MYCGWTVIYLQACKHILSHTWRRFLISYFRSRIAETQRCYQLLFRWMNKTVYKSRPVERITGLLCNLQLWFCGVEELRIMEFKSTFVQTKYKSYLALFSVCNPMNLKRTLGCNYEQCYLYYYLLSVATHYKNMIATYLRGCVLVLTVTH